MCHHTVTFLELEEDTNAASVTFNVQCLLHYS